MLVTLNFGQLSFARFEELLPGVDDSATWSYLTDDFYGMGNEGFLSGSFTVGRTLVTMDSCVVPTPTVVTPTPLDPPVPPPPYTYSTGPIYGRDNLSANIEMYRGDRYTINFQAIYDGDPLDITGGLIIFTAKWRLIDLDADAVFQLKSTGTQVVITNSVNGNIRVTIEPADTVNLPGRRTVLKYDLKYVDGFGNPYTLTSGDLVVRPNISISNS